MGLPNASTYGTVDKAVLRVMETFLTPALVEPFRAMIEALDKPDAERAYSIFKKRSWEQTMADFQSGVCMYVPERLCDLIWLAHALAHFATAWAMATTSSGASHVMTTRRPASTEMFFSSNLGPVRLPLSTVCPAHVLSRVHNLSMLTMHHSRYPGHGVG